VLVMPIYFTENALGFDPHQKVILHSS